MDKLDIKSMTLPELEAEMQKLSLPRFRGKQIFRWLQSGAETFGDMSNLPAALRAELQEKYDIAGCKIEKKLVSSLDGTVKYLYRLHDGELIESVVMQYHYGRSICISTQAGCRMGCRFCASTLNGLVRNLTASEMLSQIQTAAKDCGARISHVVLMGIGEPFDNYEQVLRFLELVGNEEGLNIGARNISLSTCGRVDGIYRLLREPRKSQITLSISLHAPNDEIRSRIMPVNAKWGVDELLRACRDYTEETSRRISFEYAMIDGVNDSDENAEELAKRLRGMLCHVNLIPVNAVKERQQKASSRERLRSFQNVLQKNGINVTIRRTLGSDINASCGQLRREGGERG